MAVLRPLIADDEKPHGISSILLDKATLDHAMRYFADERWERPRARLSTRPRLTLLAVAEFVNAAILYEHVLTGPEGIRHESLLGGAAGMVQFATAKAGMGPAETLAMLGLAKAAAAEAARAQGQVDKVSDLLGLRLDEERIVSRLERLTPSAAHVSPHHIRFLAEDIDYYPREFSKKIMENGGEALKSIDKSDGKGYWHWKYDRPFPYEPAPERFAASLIYRTHLYLLMADLIGCPYSADALRARLVPHQPRRGFADRVTTLVGEAESARDDELNQVLGYEAFKVRIPLVLKYVLSRAGRPADVLEIALETRDSRPARRFRKHCARVDAAIAEGDRDQVARACAELSAYGIRFENELGDKSSARDQTVGAAKELVSIGSPLLGAFVPGAALATGLAGGWIRRRRFTLIERLVRTPRSLNEIEREFVRLWPHL